MKTIKLHIHTVSLTIFHSSTFPIKHSCNLTLLHSSNLTLFQSSYNFTNWFLTILTHYLQCRH